MNHMPMRHRRWVAGLAKSQAHDDRRRFQRFEGVGLVAGIDKQLLEVDDISISGLRVAGLDYPRGHLMRVKLIPRQGTKLALNEAVLVDVEVVGVQNGHSRLRFTNVQYSLAKLVIRHIAQRTGTQPFIFR
jgi:hypothetical protein